MTEQTVIDMGLQTVWVAIQVAAPLLIATLVIGLIISIFQAATQINEQTLAFIPKILAITAAAAVFGPWIIQKMVNFTISLYQGIPTITM
jgi:flagellar biosynthetic protein FliQ